MPPGKTLILFAGANGSGKSTLYRDFQTAFPNIAYVNADDLLREVTGGNDPANARFAQELAERRIDELFARSESFCFETVFSHESKVALVRRAKVMGYTVTIYFTHLGSDDLNVARVKDRVNAGGHDVSEAKIRTRIPRTLENVRQALPLADAFYLFDNSRASGPRCVTKRSPGATIEVAMDAPDWAKEMARLGIETRRQMTPASSRTPPSDSPSPGFKRYRRCARCQRFLRGKRRTSYGICSICEPRIG